MLCKQNHSIEANEEEANVDFMGTKLHYQQKPEHVHISKGSLTR